nr:unnamed protein product [Callosobruchus chinensis]
MQALIGLLYLACVCQSAKQNVMDLWRSDGMGVEMFRLNMGLNRFKFLLQVLRFDDVSSADREHRRSQDKFYCMREFFDDFIRHCQENYSHSAYVTIDEILQNFRGKCSFRVYMPKKPGKFGIKIWALTDLKTFYTSNMEVYIPKQKDGPYKVDNSTRALVNRLVSGIQNTGRNVTCSTLHSIPACPEMHVVNKSHPACSAKKILPLSLAPRRLKVKMKFTQKFENKYMKNSIQILYTCFSSIKTES